MNYDKIGVLLEVKFEIEKTLYENAPTGYGKYYYMAINKVLKLIDSKIQTIMNEKEAIRLYE